MAGTSSSFNADAFRSAIRFAMNLGAPPATGDQLTFHWHPTSTTGAISDGEGVPFDPTAAVSRTTPPPVTRPCAVEYVDAADQPTPFGAVIPTKVRVTLLDEDYQAVKAAGYVIIGGDKYVRSHEPPSVGLFDVGVHTIIYAAENEL
jgi:hypothetical protein